MRITRNNACGVPVIGPKSVVVSSGFVSVQMSPQYEDGEATRKKSASGELCVVDPGIPALAQIDAEINFCGVNPDIWNIVTGQPLVLDGDSNAVGIRIGESVQSAWGLEVWTDISGVACGATPLYGYFLLPFLFNGRLGDFTIEEAAMDLTLSSSTKRGSGWGVGPYDVVLDETDAAGPLLTAIGAKDHMHMQATAVAPPTVPADCSAVALAA